MNSKSNPSFNHQVLLITPEGPKCTCPCTSAIQCMHTLAAGLMFQFCDSHGSEPLVSRETGNQVVSDDSDVEEDGLPG